MESDLRRDADCDEHGELVESAPRSDRSHGHLRCLQRDRAPLHADLRSERRRQRRAPRSSGSVAPSSGHRCRVHGAGRPVSRSGATAERQLRGFARGAQRRRRRRRTVTGARHCVGHTGRAGRTRLARGRRLQRELPAVHRRNGGRSVAPDPARHGDERARVGIHRAVRRREQHAVPARPRRELSRARRTRRTSMQSRRSVAEPDRRVPTLRRSSRPSGRATPASTGIRRPTRSRAPTICRCPTAIGSSPS